MGRDSGRSQTAAREARRPKWVRVRVETDEGAYIGSLKLEGETRSLRDVVDDGRAYLGLWSVREEPTGKEDEFVAIHKGVIRHVALLAREESLCAPAAGA